MIILNVPYSQKDEVKKLGARWNPTKKTWYIAGVEDLTPFVKWIPREKLKSIKSENIVDEDFEVKTAGVLRIWADGACEPNPGPGGWGWHRSDGESRFGGDEETTNNRMEMTAILEALRELPDGKAVIIYSDSQYCVKGLTIWRKGWQKKNWMKKGEPMINRDLWLLLEEQLSRLDVTTKWVKGHNGDAGNEKADELAVRGRMLSALPAFAEL